MTLDRLYKYIFKGDNDKNNDPIFECILFEIGIS